MNSPSVRSTWIFLDFNLLLGGDKDFAEGYEVPEGLSHERLTVDFLRKLGEVSVKDLTNRFGRDIRKKDLKFCLSSPVWDEEAKEKLQVCAQKAGLVQGPHCRDADACLKHNFELVLEPEAASIYCLQTLKGFKKGHKVLLVDAGGGTVDLVVHELLDDSGLTVENVTISTGAQCGSTFVDTAFKGFLASKIDCFKKLEKEQPASINSILRDWEAFKYGFSGQQKHVLHLSAKISKAWEKHHSQNQTSCQSKMSTYDEVLITTDDMRSFFYGQVNQILELVRKQLDQVSDVEAILVVGGFSNSPYLMKRIRDEFATSVKDISSPVDPGSAVSKGAVMIGSRGVDMVVSRKSRKTYGLSTYHLFREGDPTACREMLSDSEELWCKDAFHVFVHIGEDVPVNHSVNRQYGPGPSKESIVFTMYATSDLEPAFVTETGVEKLCSWTYNLPANARRMKTEPSVQVSMYFGRTQIQVSAEPLNFRGKKKSLFEVSFDRDLIDNDDDA